MSVLRALWTAFRRGATERRSPGPARPSDPSATLPVRELTQPDASRPDMGTRQGGEPGDIVESNVPVTPAPSPGAHPVWDALRTVIDPEVGLDIVTMGLVLDVDEEGSTTTVTFTLTTPGCPMQEILTRSIHAAVEALPGVSRVSPILVWEPRWHPGMIQDSASLE